MQTFLKLSMITLAALATTAQAQRTIYQVDASASGEVTDFVAGNFEERIDRAFLGGTDRRLSSIEVTVGGALDTPFNATADIQVRIYDSVSAGAANVLWTSDVLAAQPLNSANPGGGSTFSFSPAGIVNLPSTIYYGVAVLNITSPLPVDSVGPLLSDANPTPTSQDAPQPPTPFAGEFWLRSDVTVDSFVPGTFGTDKAATVVIHAIPEPGAGAQLIFGASILALIIRLRNRR